MNSIPRFMKLRYILSVVSVTSLINHDFQLQPSFAANDISYISNNEITNIIIDVKFSDFISSLDSDEVSKVVFKGINPDSCIVYFKSGKIGIVKEGFPAYNDPKSPSGPAQAIAKVQHTPGVICEQDISDVLLLSTTRRQTKPSTIPMQTQSKYPK